MKIYSLLFAVLLLASCSEQGANEELISTKKALLEAETKIAALEAEGDLVHVVYFDMKDDADVSAFITEIEKLRNIEEVQNLEVGTFKNLGDERALSQYELVMQMSFKDSAAYQIYQNHPIHLQLKAAAKSVVAAAPATYDFVRK
jgi:hypothetical protein